MAREMVYDFRAQGAEETAAKIRSLNEEFRRGGIGLEEFGRKKRELRREGIAYQDTFRMETQLWLNAHPNMQKLSNSMSAFTGILQTGLAVTNAMNLAQLVTQGQSSTMMQLKAEESQLQRELNIAIKQYGEGSIEAAAIQEELGIKRQQVLELQKQEQAQWISNAITMGTSMALISGQIIQTIPKIAALTANVKLMTLGFTALSPAITATTTSLTGLGAALSLVTAATALIAGFFVGTELRESNRAWLETIQNDWANFINGQIVLGNEWIGFYTIDLPAAWEATTAAFVDFFTVQIPNAAITMGNIMNRAVEAFVNMWINAFNAIIIGMNRIPGVNIGLIPKWTAPQIPLISAATGFQGTLQQDTMFQAHKGEHVSITPAGGGSTGGTTINNYYTIEGSIWSERELMDRIDEHRQRDIRDRR